MSTRGTPESAVSPAPLLSLLPAVYREDDLSRRWLAAFDTVLAPVLTQLDCLEAYLDARLAPEDFLDWLGSWLGLAVDPQWSVARRRELIAQAGRLYRLRGTLDGVQELLELTSGLTVELDDGVEVSWSREAGAEPPTARAPRLQVRIRGRASDEQVEQVRALAAAVSPAHVPVRVVAGRG